MPLPDLTQGSIDNLWRMLWQADEIDTHEGQLAYTRYATLLRQLADCYGVAFDRTVAGFVAMSPNNDYFGNLKSLVTVLHNFTTGIPAEQTVISTYRHCMERAWSYIDGSVDFMTTVKGPKIRAFYQNILDPSDPEPVTIDGHMVAAWMGQPLTMKDAIIRPNQYEILAEPVRRLASNYGMVANQIQAIIWFTRKRVLRVRYDPQMDLLHAADRNVWRTLMDLDTLRPYPARPLSGSMTSPETIEVSSSPDTGGRLFNDL